MSKTEWENKVRHFLRVSNLNRMEIAWILLIADKFRTNLLKWIYSQCILHWMPIHAYFAKPSNRTSTSIETAIKQLWWVPIIREWQNVLPWQDWKYRENPEDIVSVAQSQYAKIIFARVFNFDTLEQMANVWSVFTWEEQPIIVNALCDKHHPLQALADIMTINSFSRTFRWKIRVAFIWDWNNVANSLWQICAIIWVDFAIASPKKYQLWNCEKDVIEYLASQSWSKIEFHTDPKKAVKGANFVNTDTFISMWEEDIAWEKIKAFDWYQVDKSLMSIAHNNAYFMHCLPAYRWMEVSHDVIDDKNRSLVWEQARARQDTVKALIPFILKINGMSLPALPLD